EGAVGAIVSGTAMVAPETAGGNDVPSESTPEGPVTVSGIEDRGELVRVNVTTATTSFAMGVEVIPERRQITEPVPPAPFRVFRAGVRAGPAATETAEISLVEYWIIHSRPAGAGEPLSVRFKETLPPAGAAPDDKVNELVWPRAIPLNRIKARISIKEFEIF